MKSGKSAAHHGRTLERAARELAACRHVEDDCQYLLTSGDDGAPAGKGVRRCVACGAVAYERDGFTRWTRPELVAHVMGALS
jgi:hypothetical protein